MVDGVSVILNEVKNRVVTIGCSIEILRLTPQNDIVTQSLRGEESVFPLPFFIVNEPFSLL